MISGFRRKLIARQISGGAVDINGRWTGESESDIALWASVQPATAQDLLTLEEGRRNRASFVLFTDTELNTFNEQNPHRIQLFGEEYEVVGRANWQNEILSHYRVLVQKTVPVNA